MKISAYFQLPQIVLFTGASIFTLEFNHIAMAQRACVRTDAGRVVCGNLVRENNTQQAQSSNSSQVLEASGIKFELQRCVRSGNSVNCNLLLTNLEQRDQEILLSGNSRLITVSGEEFSSESVYLGGRSGRRSNSIKLVSQIPIKATVSFKQIPQNASKLALVEIVYLAGRTVDTVQFRNVALNSR